jgi:hypothetical protein
MAVAVGTFDERIDLLIDAVGHGTVEGSVEFNQAYARRQHWEVTWHHPRGGEPLYLTSVLFEHEAEFMENLASSVLEVGGPKEGMKANVEILAERASAKTPIMWGVLRFSAHPVVRDSSGLEIVYDRPPMYGRLSDEELDDLHRAWERLYPNPWTPGDETYAEQWKRTFEDPFT